MIDSKLCQLCSESWNLSFGSPMANRLSTWAASCARASMGNSRVRPIAKRIVHSLSFRLNFSMSIRASREIRVSSLFPKKTSVLKLEASLGMRLLSWLSSSYSSSRPRKLWSFLASIFLRSFSYTSKGKAEEKKEKQKRKITHNRSKLLDLGDDNKWSRLEPRDLDLR